MNFSPGKKREHALISLSQHFLKLVQAAAVPLERVSSQPRDGSLFRVSSGWIADMNASGK